MKHKSLIYLFLGTSLLLTGCNLFEKPKPKEDNTPVFNLSADTLTMHVGEEKQVQLITKNCNITDDPIWTSDDETIAKFDKDKKSIVALSLGETFIRVKAVDSKTKIEYKDEIKVNVTGMWDESQNSLRNGVKTLDFYNLNDFHGAVEYNPDFSEPGINYLSSYINKEMGKNVDGSILTSSGDMWQGSCDSNLSKGQLVVDWMNILNFSAQAVGNHEFDWTIDTIKTNEEKMNFPMLACNIYNVASDTPVDWVEPYTTITKNGVHIGVIGAIGKGLTSSIISKNVAGLEFKDPNPLIKTYADELREKGADVVLVLLHDETTNIYSATYSKIDALFGGHSHTGENENVSGVPAIQAWCNGKDLGHISLTYDFSSNSVTKSSGEILDTRASKCSPLGEDAVTKAMYDEYLASDLLAPKFEILSNYNKGISRDEIPYVYNAYAYKYYKEVHGSDGFDIIAVNTNDARSAIPSGESITFGNVYKALPFDNTLCVMSVLGSDVSKVCNYGYFSMVGNQYATYMDISSACNDKTKRYYFLTIDYIATNSYKSRYVTVEKIYEEEDALPRNIFRKYLSGYPNNATI